MASKHIILGHTQPLLTGINEASLAQQGFVIAPFNENEKECVFINTIKEITITQASALEIPSEWNALLSFVTDASHVEQTQKNDYIHQFEQIKQLIINGTCQKAILSRLKIEPGVPSSQLLNLFDALCLLYPHAFVYLLNTPQTGVWSGASPELLLRKNNHSLHTVALAGTMPNATQHITWGQKELDEQAMVTNYIHDLFKKAGIHHYTTQGPHTVTAGQVCHLKTDFALPNNDVNHNTAQLISQLHPTPAVCGLPKVAALESINAIETHQREYYAGFLGPVDKNNFDLFVNIRCMQLTHHKAILYVGGGLTIGSEAEKEWNETELKAQTLLSVLKNMRNLQGYE